MINDKQLWWHACYGNKSDVATVIAEGLAKKASPNHIKVEISTALWMGGYWIFAEEVVPSVTVKGIAPSR